MSYPRLGYHYSPTPQFLMAAGSLTSCCEPSIRTAGAASPAYESRLVARHDLDPAASLGVYPGSQGYGKYLSYGTEPSALYSRSTFEANDGPASVPAGLPPVVTYYPYDSALGQYQYDRYGSMDAGGRRKNATRETTSTLKAWLNDHRRNPYPTKGEKIMLAIITKMTLTQVSTWFANARRRLKKENKVTWPPRTKSFDEEEADEQGEGGKGEAGQFPYFYYSSLEHQAQGDLLTSDLDDFHSIASESSDCELKPRPVVGALLRTGCTHDCPKEAAGPVCIPESCESFINHGALEKRVTVGETMTLENKPKIWSLAQTATSLKPAEYPSCMQRCPSIISTSVESMDWERDSPVVTLRNWVDGVFHDPLFRHRSLNQVLADRSLSGASAGCTTVDTSVGNGVLKQQVTTIRRRDPNQDLMDLRKEGSKLFFSY